MSLSSIREYRQYRVPSENNASLIDPELSCVEATLDARPSIHGSDGLEFCGKPMERVRRDARVEVIELAREHTRQYRDTACLSAEECELQPLVLSGHQPELFHPGVWFKNFLLSHLSKSKQAVAINFLVDNDLCRSNSIRVPTQLKAGVASTANVPFDTIRDSIPWELRSLNDRDVWESFPARVSEQLHPSAQAPLLHDMWPQASESLKRHGNLGLAIAEGRHKLEAEAGLQSLEVPLSQLVGTRAFARFSIQLLGELPRFQDVYNGQRELYRAAHRIRNDAHPVPALGQRDGWIEAPWWVYRSQSPYRKPLWVRLQNDQLFLSDRAGWQDVIEGRLDCDNAASQWLDFQADGVCIRPRALLTTMYLRLIVSDFFIHGIGGGKYDQLTDSILAEFFGVQPPPMAVATATEHLPLDSKTELDSVESVDAQARQLRDRLWQIQHHPEALAENLDAQSVRLAERKAELLNHIPPRGEKWNWHREMKSINQQLSQSLQPLSTELQLELEQLANCRKQLSILKAREYSFCLFPQGYLVQRLSAAFDGEKENS